jgi:ribosomal protein S27AE
MTIFQENWLTVSLKRFVQLEMPKCRLVYYGRNKYYGNCRLLKHREVAGEGQSFLMDEHKGRASCVGKCGFQGADINQIGAYLWGCTNTEAAKRIQRDTKKYGPPSSQ